SRLLRLADQDAVRLDLHGKQELPRVLQDIEEVRPQKDLAAADREEEDTGLGKLVQHVLDLGERHLTVIIVIEIAVDAPLVAAVRDVELHAERDAQAERLGAHLLHQRAHRPIIMCGALPRASQTSPRGAASKLHCNPDCVALTALPLKASSK